MSIFSSQKFRITVGCAALLLTGFAGNHLHNQSRTKSVAQQQPTQQSLSPSQAAAEATSLENSAIAQRTPATRQQPATASEPYQVIDEQRNFQFSINAKQIFNSGKLPNTKINFNQADLLTVLINTKKYFQDYATEDPVVQRTGVLGSMGVTVEDILKTMDFMIAVLREDIAKGRPTRLQDPNFINANFRVIKWSPYNPKRPQQRQLRLTKYAVFTHPGSRTKTSKFNTAIYSLKDEFAADNFFTKYTKQDVLSGIFEPGGKEHGKVEPLAYLTRDGLEDALMQGTILINFTDGSRAFFNVDRNNGMPFIKGLAPRAQKRYWYFREVNAIRGYGYKIDAKIPIRTGVTFAGDVLNIGLGRVIALEYNQGGKKRLKLGVLADTGGAFLPNLYQLDFLAGTFRNQQDFMRNISQLPEFVTAYILVKK
jgi:hypothetical protein